MLTTAVLLVASAASVSTAPSPCVHRLPGGAGTYDLSAFRNITIYGPKSTGGRFAQSLCGLLPFKCEDSLTGANMSGAVFQYYGGPGGEWHCWDVLVPAFSANPNASALPGGARGLTLTWTHHGDAHLSCERVVVSTSIFCDLNAPVEPARAQLEGTQTQCTWNIDVRTASPSVCGGRAKGGALGKEPVFLYSESIPSAAAPDRKRGNLLVRTKSNGYVRGQNSQTGHARYFLGIPYATADRWKAPEPIAALDDNSMANPHNATMFGPSCWQQGGIAGYLQAEQCLNLNVFAPSITDPNGYAVLFWIHGGCYDFGTANQRIGNGTDIVEKFRMSLWLVSTTGYPFSAFWAAMLSGEIIRSPPATTVYWTSGRLCAGSERILRPLEVTLRA